MLKYHTGTMENREKAFFTNNGGMLLYGLSAVLIGPTLPGMISTFGLSLSQGGLISAAQNMGGFLGALLTLWIADRVSHPKAALASFLLLSVALFAVGVAPVYLVLLFAFGATGFFIRVLDVMLNAHTGELAGPRSGRRLSMLHLFFSVGAFVGPVVARALMSGGLSWDGVYRSVGVGYVLAAILAIPLLRAHLRMEAPGEGEAGHPETRSPGSRAAELGPDGSVGSGQSEGVAWTAASLVPVVILGMALFFYAIHQVGLTSWVPYFLESSRGAGANAASIGLSAYWVGIIAGRFLMSRVVDRVGESVILVSGAVVSAAATLGAVLIPTVWLAQGLLVVAGITSGATIPLAYSFGFFFLPRRTGSVTAVMALLMLLGRILGPWAIGGVADHAGLLLAMTIPGWALLFTAASVAVVWALSRRRVAGR
jgi:fucose permease